MPFPPYITPQEHTLCQSYIFPHPRLPFPIPLFDLWLTLETSQCCLWCGICAFTGAQCILQFLNRQDMRKQYNIAGSAGKDFCISWCCANCALVQERKEVEYQNSRKGGAPGVPGGVGSGGVTAQPVFLPFSFCLLLLWEDLQRGGGS